MAPVERYFQSFDATNSLQSTVLRMKCGVNIWFFANSKSVYYLRTPPFPTSEIVSNEIELIHDVNQHSTLGNNMTYMCSKNGDHLSYDEVQVRSKLHFGVTQPTATIPTIWGEALLLGNEVSCHKHCERLFYRYLLKILYKAGN